MIYAIGTIPTSGAVDSNSAMRTLSAVGLVTYSTARAYTNFRARIYGLPRTQVRIFGRAYTDFGYT